MATSGVIDRDRGWKDIKSRMNKAQKRGGLVVTVGIQQEDAQATYPEGASIGLIATVHEFGSPARNIPQRSFLGATFDKNRKKYERMLNRLMEKVSHPSGPTWERGLAELGEIMRTDIVMAIKAGLSPPLSIRAASGDRQGGVPLWDTGFLLGTIRSVVR